MFKQRLISATILTPCVVITIFVLPLLAFKILSLSICILTAWEWGKLSHLSPKAQKIWMLVIFTLSLIFLQTSTQKLFFDSYNKNIIAYIILIWWTIALLLVLFYPNSAKLWNKFTIAWLMFGTLIILSFLWGILVLRHYGYNENNYIGIYWLLYTIILVWGMDTFSYIIGRILGRNKATPILSPYKTWEGYIGGILIMIIISLIFLRYIPINVKCQKLAIYSIIIIFSSILGDLTESMFKREANIKDSGQLIPGHGGILDAMDSLYSAISILSALTTLIE